MEHLVNGGNDSDIADSNSISSCFTSLSSFTESGSNDKLSTNKSSFYNRKVGKK